MKWEGIYLLSKTLVHVIKNNPLLLALASKVYYYINKNTKIVTGASFSFNGAFLKRVSIDVAGKNNKIVIEQYARISNVKIYMRGDNHTLFIGSKCRIAGGSFWFEDEGCSIRVGEGTTIESAHIAVTEPNRAITVGKDCMFSYDIDIRSGDSHSIVDLGSGKRINHAKDIAIGDHVWLGAHVTILKGVSIANNVVVGTGSIVVESVNEGHSIVAGAPGKIVKSNIDWRRERMQ